MTKQEFIRSYTGNARHFACRLLSETNGHAATEALIAHVADECGVDAETRETVIMNAVDQLIVRSTVYQMVSTGRVVPMLIQA